MTNKTPLKTNMWVLVCDQSKALLLKNAGDAVFPKLETQKILEHKDFPHNTSRNHNKDGSTRHHGEADFMRSVAGEINSLVEQHKIADLLIAAPARSLGQLREFLSPHAAHVTRGELVQDLVKLPLYEIEEHIKRA